MQEGKVAARWRAVAREFESVAKAGAHVLAVGKTYPAECVIEAADAGAARFGENYVQEAVEKIERVRALRPDLKLEWRLIGPLQSNKTRVAAQYFDWIESVDRLKIAQRLSEQRPPELGPINVLIEVNVDGEATKSGVAPDELAALAQSVATLPNLTLRGIMVIPAPEGDAAASFARARALFEKLKERYDTVDTLSMGMSADWREALEAGSTEVRIGSAIFGARDYSKKKAV